MIKDLKLVIIGIDGGTWDLLLPLIKKNKLAVFEKLMKGGVWGKLKSTIPPTTGPAWTSIATGKNPGKHGIYDFVKFKEKKYDTDIITSSDIQTITFYNILSLYNKSSILINLPGTFPPKKINGIIVPDFLTSIPMTYPKDIKERYLKDYRFFYDKSKDGLELVNDILDVMKKKVKLTRELFTNENWDLFFVLFSASDWVSHHFWFDILEDTPLGKKAVKVFELLNDIIEWIIENIDKNTNLIILSDHGFRSCGRLFCINEWLGSNGKLKKKAISKKESNLKDYSKFIFDEDLEKANILTKIVYKNFLKNPRLPGLQRSNLINSMANFLILGIISGIREINLKGSIAFSPTSGCHGIVINSKKRFEHGFINDESKESNIKEIINDLKNLKDPKNGKNVIKNVFEKEEIYWGEKLDSALDIIFVPNDNYNISSSLTKAIFIDKRTSFHAPYGIFLAYGPNIRSDYQLKGATLYDLAPTILFMFGLPVQEDMDGKVLKTIFKIDSEMAQRDIEYKSYSIEKDKITEHIKKIKFTKKI